MKLTNTEFSRYVAYLEKEHTYHNRYSGDPLVFNWFFCFYLKHNTYAIFRENSNLVGKINIHLN